MLPNTERQMGYLKQIFIGGGLYGDRINNRAVGRQKQRTARQYWRPGSGQGGGFKRFGQRNKQPNKNKQKTNKNKSFLEETMEVVNIKKADDMICCICSLKIYFHSILIHEHHSYKSGVLQNEKTPPRGHAIQIQGQGGIIHPPEKNVRLLDRTESAFKKNNV